MAQGTRVKCMGASSIFSEHFRAFCIINFASKIIEIFQTLYSQGSTSIKLEHGYSSNIEITEGLMQGDSASPICFSLYINDIADVLCKSGISGIRITENLELHILLFADDAVVLASSSRALQLKLNLLEKYFKSLDLKVNLMKTQVVVFRRGGRLQSDLKFLYGGQELEIVNEYTYLGVLFSSSGLFRKAAESFKKKGMKAVGSLWPIIYRGEVDNWDSHSKLFNTIAATTVLYSFHVWAYHYPDIVEQVQTRFL